jgi:hypothetical protein
MGPKDLKGLSGIHSSEAKLHIVNAFPVYPIPFMQYHFFQDFSRYSRDALICIKKCPFKHFSLLKK